MKTKMTRNQAVEEMHKRYNQAEDLLKDDAKMEPFLEKLEKKVKWTMPWLLRPFGSMSIRILTSIGSGRREGKK